MTLDWTKLPSLTALRAFEAAARAKSFSAAARSLNVTHAAVAQQVRALEEFIGMQLLERSARGVSLTSEGQELAKALATGFAAIAEGIDSLQEKNRSRPVRVTTTAYFAEAVIFPKITEFWSTAPEIEVSFTPSDKNIDLVAEGFDLAIRAGDGNWPGLKSQLLIESPTRAFAAPSLVENSATNWDEVPWLIPSDSFWEREALEESGIDTSTIRTLELGNPSLEIRAGEEGMGLVLESEIDVHAQVEAGTLKIAPIPITNMSRYFIVTPPWKPRPPVAAFIEWLKSVGPSFGEDLPRKVRNYDGVVSDTRVWDDFELRPDDVVISTPPKCGTTWTQTIALMLIRQLDRLDDSVWKLSPWIDCKFRSESPELLEEATGRRCIKSHAPFDGIKFNMDATYIAVYRHPVDVHFSLQNHAQNMKEDWLDFMYSGDTAANFERFTDHPTTVAGTDDTTLASIVEHFVSFRRWRDLPNVHLFHYADLKRDLHGQICRLDSLLSTHCSPAVLDRITSATTFQSMKNAAAKHIRKEEESPFKDELSFFKSARSGKWQGRLNSSQMESFGRRLATLVEPDDAEWLCWGAEALRANEPAGA